MYKNNFIGVIKHKGQILREVDGDVILPFGSQYSILLKNKDSRRALVDIEVDGENVLMGKSLIINGNTSQEIKGFMRDMSVTNQFKFIHKTKEISNYRGDRVDDGLIRINYSFEQEKIQPITVVDDYPSWPFPKPGPCPRKPWEIKYCSSYNDNTSNSFIGSYSNSLTSNNAGSKTVTAATAAIAAPVVVSQNYLDDGITVKGSKISQQYQYGNIGELESRSYVIVLRLKGKTKCKKVVTKPLTTKVKLQCSTCGRYSKSSSTFCYNCGTYLR